MKLLSIFLQKDNTYNNIRNEKNRASPEIVFCVTDFAQSMRPHLIKLHRSYCFILSNNPRVVQFKQTVCIIYTLEDLKWYKI